MNSKSVQEPERAVSPTQLDYRGNAGPRHRVIGIPRFRFFLSDGPAPCFVRGVPIAIVLERLLADAPRGVLGFR